MNSKKYRERSRDKEIKNEKKTKSKKGKKAKKEKLSKSNENILDNDSHNDNQKININHHWKKYFDCRYNQIFYNNPFTGESVWELHEGAIVEESNGPIEIITAVPQEEKSNKKNKDEKNNNKEKSENKENNEEDSLTEENKESTNINNINLNSYKEIEAIEVEELKERLRYRKMKNLQLQEWLKRPARQQVEESKREIAYTEGHYDYNIWYDKYLSDRTEDKEKIAAETKCNPTLDTGYTRADKQQKKNNSYF